MELHTLSGTQLGKLIQDKELSTIEVIKYFSDIIEAKNSKLNAFVYLNIEDALKEAEKIQKRVMSGEYVGPFAGVPICLKDFLPSKIGWPNTHGGVKSLTAIDDEDSQFYTAARALGAIAVGKTNAPHFGFRGTCDNKLYGPTHNPFNLSKNSGGSSGGTASAVAAGLVPFGEGGDAGGSIRIPSSWCNCFGFKANPINLQSFRGKPFLNLVHPFCTNGAITRTVEDSFIIWEQMTGGIHTSDPFDFDIESKFIKNLKIGLTLDFGLYQTDLEIKNTVNTIAKFFADHGAKVELLDMHFKYDINELAKMWCVSLSIGTSIDLGTYERQGIDLRGSRKDELSESFLYYDMLACESRTPEFHLWRDMYFDIYQQIYDPLSHYDLILAPVTACNPVDNSNDGDTLGPTTIGGVESNPVIGFTETFLLNFLKVSAASVPAGFTHDGLPIGVQLIGKKDRDVMYASRFIEECRPWTYDKVVI